MRMGNKFKFLLFWGLFFLLVSGLHVHAVVVSTVGELETAVSNANSGGDKEIILKNGTYTLNDVLGIWADGVTVRSQSGSRANVKIYGQGMYGGVTHIFNVAGTDFTAKDMTIGRVSNHAIQIWGNNNSSNTLLSNLHIVDTYEQMVKISYDPSSSNCSENGVMQNCLLEYTAEIGPQYYIGGIDGHQTKNWIVRNNVFKNISSPSGDVAEHAVHFWSDSKDTLVENNWIINCDRGIGFGLGNRGHIRGIIRNNMIYHSSTDHGFADVGIGLENASNAKVYNNTVFLAHSYPNAIEYRFSGTSGGIIKNNLCNKSITSRDGGSAQVSHNTTSAQSSWFVNLSSGDLHLASAVSQVVDKGVSISGLVSDFDGDSRPQGSGIDIGADEYVTAAPATITVISPNGGEMWEIGSTQNITWSSTGTVGNVKIEYSIDNGSTWSIIKSSTANDGIYSWSGPDTVSSQCLVRISEASDGDPMDTSDAVFSIVSSTITAVISLNRRELVFGASTSGVTSGTQTFSISNTGYGTLHWNVSDDAGWLSCAPTSGTGSAMISVSVIVSGLSAGTYTGTVTVSSPNASNSPQTVAVTLNVYASGGDSAPFGSFDSPVHGSTVRSSIPVTGWALDDIGVESVKIYRDPVGGEGSGLVYIGDALLVEGARTDIESAYPGYPMNYKAGWGYMMLTNFLPNSGNGTFVIYALAADACGHQVTLGSKTITCDNVNAVKPFGAIDTPAPGETVSGSNYSNIGWVLTPLPNKIPEDGSTINVYIDGVDLGHPTYNIYRSDIAELFPGYANSDGAVAYLDFDTTTYTNGVHTIAWSAVDNAGNTDGIGSRYFTIQNSEAAASRKMAAAFNVQRSMFNVNPNQLPVDYFHPVRIKKGFNPNTGPVVVYPNDKGIITTEIKELERVEIHLFDSTVNIEPRAFNISQLPIGSTLDTKRGVFYWQPGPGFIGDYQFIFIIKEEKTEGIRARVMRIKIIPKFEQK